jgi:hypothetical protein
MEPKRCWATNRWKVLLRASRVKERITFSQIYPSQTKMLEGWTKDEIRIFEALFKGVSTRFWLRTIEKSVENPDFIFCSSFQNLRLGSIKFRLISRNYRPAVGPRENHCRVKGVCVSRHLNDDLICDHMTMFQLSTSTTMCQSRSQDDESMMIFSIETHGITDAMLSGVRATRVKGVCVSRHLNDDPIVITWRCVSRYHKMMTEWWLFR